MLESDSVRSVNSLQHLDKVESWWEHSCGRWDVEFSAEASLVVTVLWLAASAAVLFTGRITRPRDVTQRPSGPTARHLAPVCHGGGKGTTTSVQLVLVCWLFGRPIGWLIALLFLSVCRIFQCFYCFCACSSCVRSAAVYVPNKDQKRHLALCFKTRGKTLPF